MQTRISDWIFDFSQPIYLIHPNFKFWQIKVTGKNIGYRVGKVKDAEEQNIEEIDKNYANAGIARSTATTKIEQKLTKGYTPKDGKKAERIDEQKKVERLKDSSTNKKVFSGQYYEKGNEATRLQVNEKRVKITRIDKGVEKYEIRSFESYANAVDFCFQEESWLLSQGYKANNSKFIYSFIDDNLESQVTTKKKTTEKLQVPKSESNYLSITKLTDDAISHRSKNHSVAKSDRSYVDNEDGEDNDYVSSKLGKPASGPISVLLAQSWSNQVDPANWIMSEKLDGVRCF